MSQRWYAGRWCAALLAITAAAANSVWVLLDRTSPSWDQASYLYLAVVYNDTIAASGLGALPDMMQASDPSRGPLFILGIMPLLALLGDGPTSALALNALVAPIAYFAAGETAFTLFRSWVARLLAIVMMAGIPLLVGLQHEVLVDFLLVALTCVGLMFLVKSQAFMRRWMTILMALTFALGTLTKVTFPVFVLGPLLVVVVQVLVLAIRERGGAHAVQRLVNVAMALALYVAVVSVWYLPNRQATVDYVQSTTGGALSVGAGPANPLTWGNVTAFAVSVVNDHLSWPVLLVSVFLVLWHARTVLGWPREQRATNWAHAALLVSWFAVPYLLLVTGSNQDVRLMAPAFAAVAVGVAGGLASLRPNALRVSLVAVTVAVLVFQTVNRLVPVAPSWLADGVTVQVGNQTLRAPIGSSAPIGYERLPRRDRATPIYDWLEDRAERNASGGSTGVVCFLVTYPFVNSNTFRYLVAANDDAFELRDVLLGPGGKPALRDELRDCDFALYDDLRRRADTGQVRLDYVNSPYAGNHATRSMLEVFDGPSQVFPTGDASRAESDAWPRDTGRITVLSKLE